MRAPTTTPGRLVRRYFWLRRLGFKPAVAWRVADRLCTEGDPLRMAWLESVKGNSK